MWKRVLLLGLAVPLMSCSGLNLFEEFGDKTSDEARHFAAKRLIDDGSFAEAIAEFENMSAAYLAQRQVAVDYASAHAGLCGLDFLTLVSSLEGLSSSRLFLLMMESFTGATLAEAQSCIAAQSILESINASAFSRNLDENLLMVFVQFAKMGSIFSATADTDANAVLDPAFDACDPIDISEDEVRDVGSSIVHIIASLSAIGDNASIADGALDDISTLMDSITGSYDICDDNPNGSGDCTNTDPSSFDANEVRAIRTFINENDAVGLGSCTGDFAACLCL